ncbi:MAG: HigA family addiction module antitoxin [Alphaproteobacteria bacterium]|nr:HigA family addiction module antitoxin [Alphaproteobacteria bacterium]
MTMKNPPHPGLTVKHDCLEELGLSVTAGADALGVTRVTLSKLINGQSGISPEMAVRLAKAFGGSAETWLGMQIDFDLARVRNKGDIMVQRVARVG